MMYITGDAESNLLDTFYAVEATHTEYFFLWKDHNKEIEWDQGSSGWGVTVGHLDEDRKKPVCISVQWANIGGKKVLFYETTSRFVDHEMVREWLNKHCPALRDPRGRFHTDAMNFHHCLSAIKHAV